MVSGWSLYLLTQHLAVIGLANKGEGAGGWPILVTGKVFVVVSCLTLPVLISRSYGTQQPTTVGDGNEPTFVITLLLYTMVNIVLAKL